jgi:uncharacterized protein
MNQITQVSNYTLITGASGGIGLALAEQFAMNKHNLFLVARSEEKLKQISENLTINHKVTVQYLSIDLTNDNAVDKLFEEINKRGIMLNTLINNAGFGYLGEFIEDKIDNQLNMIDLNIRVLVEVSHKFLENFRNSTETNGHLINIASVAGFLSGPYMSTYYATKNFVVSWSEALSKELENQNMKVLCVCPGPVKTDFADRSNLNKAKMFTMFKPVSPEFVAIKTYNAMLENKLIEIPGFTNKLIPNLVKFLPRSIRLNAIKNLHKM